MESGSNLLNCVDGAPLTTEHLDFHQILQTAKVLLDSFGMAKPIRPDPLKTHHVEESVGLYGIFYRNNHGKFKGLKVGISKNLNRRLTDHFRSRQSGLKIKNRLTGKPEKFLGDPKELVSKKSILAKHLFFDDELGREFDVILKTEAGRITSLTSRCLVLVRPMPSIEKAKDIEKKLEASGNFRYVGKVVRRP